MNKPIQIVHVPNVFVSSETLGVTLKDSHLHFCIITGSNPVSVVCEIFRDHETEQQEFPLSRNDEYVYSAVIDASDIETLIMYRYRVEYDDKSIVYINDPCGSSLIVTNENMIWDVRYMLDLKDTVSIQRLKVNWKHVVIFECHLQELANTAVEFFNDESNPVTGDCLEKAAKLIPLIKTMGYGAIELMPIIENNKDPYYEWGYEPISQSHIKSSYGTPSTLKSFIRIAHDNDIAVILDVVPNHMKMNIFGNRNHPFILDNSHEIFKSYKAYGGERLNFSNQYTRRWLHQCYMELFDVYGVDGLRVDSIQTLKFTETSKVIHKLLDFKRKLSSCFSVKEPLSEGISMLKEVEEVKEEVAAIEEKIQKIYSKYLQQYKDHLDYVEEWLTEFYNDVKKRDNPPLLICEEFTGRSVEEKKFDCDWSDITFEISHFINKGTSLHNSALQWFRHSVNYTRVTYVGSHDTNFDRKCEDELFDRNKSLACIFRNDPRLAVLGHGFNVLCLSSIPMSVQGEEIQSQINNEVLSPYGPKCLGNTEITDSLRVMLCFAFINNIRKSFPADENKVPLEQIKTKTADVKDYAKLYKFERGGKFIIYLNLDSRQEHPISPEVDVTLVFDSNEIMNINDDIIEGIFKQKEKLADSIHSFIHDIQSKYSTSKLLKETIAPESIQVYQVNTEK